MALRIVVADDHPLLARGVCDALDEVDDMAVVGVARSGSEVLSLVRRTNPDVVLLDVRMPGLDGLATLDRIRARYPSVKVVMFSASSNQEQIAAAFRRGASSYIVKSVNPVDLPSALRQAYDQTVFRPLVADADPISNDEQPLDLTERELEILRSVARGMSNGDIAKELWVTEQTVKFHLTNIFRKLGVRNRTAATRVAHQHGLVESVVA